MMARRSRCETPPRLPPDSMDYLLESLLVEWGDWVRQFAPRLGIGSSSPMFRDVRCGIDWSLDCYETVDVEKLRTVNACIDDLTVASPRWLVIHWHYAQGNHRRGPAAKNGNLPRFGSDDYMILLNGAQRGIRDGLAKRNALHLIE